jgi:hypothetical protein
MVVTRPSAAATVNGMNINEVKTALDSEVEAMPTWQNVPGRCD